MKPPLRLVINRTDRASKLFDRGVACSWVTIIGTGSTAGVMGVIALGWTVNQFSTLRGDTNEDRVWLAFFAAVLGFFLGIAVGTLTPLVDGGGRAAKSWRLVRLAAIVFVVAVKLVAWIQAPPPATIQGENLVARNGDPDASPNGATSRVPRQRGFQSSARLAPNTDRENGIVEWDRLEPSGDSRLGDSLLLRPSSFPILPRAGSIYAPPPWVRSITLSHSGAIRTMRRLPWRRIDCLITLPRDSFS